MYVDKKNTFSSKWDEDNSSYLSFTVADMDFSISPTIKKAIYDRNKNSLYSYTFFSEQAKKSIKKWLERRHQVTIDTEWILFVPRISYAYFAFLNAFTEVNDGVLVPLPSYGPLYQQIISNNRKPIHLNLDKKGLDYFFPKELKVDEFVSSFLLISPHNPTGRVWTLNELQKILKFSKENDISLFVDEVHSDFVSQDEKHYNFLQFYPHEYQKFVYANSLSKTFNIPGLMLSYLVIPDDTVRQKMKKELDCIGIHNVPSYANEVFIAAYENEHSEKWLETVKQNILDNQRYINYKLSKFCPKIKVKKLASTYMLLLDFNCFKMNNDQLQDWFREHCQVKVNMGEDFIDNFDKVVRINLATSKENIVSLTERIISKYELLF